MNLLEERDHLRAAVDILLPIVEEVFYDQHSAGRIPGSGYNHRAYHMVSKRWGWHDATAFKTFADSLKVKPLRAWLAVEAPKFVMLRRKAVGGEPPSAWSLHGKILVSSVSGATLTLDSAFREWVRVDEEGAEHPCGVVGLSPC